jgi:hypothetical protein
MGRGGNERTPIAMKVAIRLAAAFRYCEECDKKRDDLYRIDGLWLAARIWCGDCLTAFWLSLSDAISTAHDGQPLQQLGEKEI